MFASILHVSWISSISKHCQTVDCWVFTFFIVVAYITYLSIFVYFLIFSFIIFQPKNVCFHFFSFNFILDLIESKHFIKLLFTFVYFVLIFNNSEMPTNANNASESKWCWSFCGGIFVFYNYKYNNLDIMNVIFFVLSRQNDANGLDVYVLLIFFTFSSFAVFFVFRLRSYSTWAWEI